MAKKKKEPTLEEQHDAMIDQITENVDSLKDDLEKARKFKAAARRARKATNALTHDFKEFRRISNDYDKER